MLVHALITGMAGIIFNECDSLFNVKSNQIKSNLLKQKDHMATNTAKSMIQPIQ